MKRLEFNFFQSFAPEEMLRRLKEPSFIEVQKSSLKINGNGDFDGSDVEISIGFLLSNRRSDRTEYETFIIEKVQNADGVLDELMNYIDDNIEELVLLLKLQ